MSFFKKFFLLISSITSGNFSQPTVLQAFPVVLLRVRQVASMKTIFYLISEVKG